MKTLTFGQGLKIHDFNAKAVLVADTNVSNLASSLHNTNVINNLASLFTDKAQFVNSVKWYPFNLEYFMQIAENESNLTLGGGEAVSGTNVWQYDDNNSKAQRWKIKEVEDIKRSYKIATITISETFNNFMDYEPYTTAQIYLPYLGFYALPVKDCMGKTIDVYYSIDFDTGMATAYLQTQGTDARCIMMASGKIGIDVPIGSGNANEIAKANFENSVKLLASGLAIAGGVASGKLVGGLLVAKGTEMALTTGVNFVTDQQRHYQRGSLTGGQDALLSPTSVYVVIHKPSPLRVNYEWRRLKGVPLGEVKNLSSLSGFTTVSHVHVEGSEFSTATSQEINEIESLLKEGVIL